MPHFYRNGKFPLAERQQKCHYLDNSQSWLRPGAFCSLQQLSSLTGAKNHIGAVVFKIESRYKISTFLFKDEYKEAAVQKMLLQFCWLALRIFWYINSTQRQTKCKWCKCCCSHYFDTQKQHERTKRTEGRAWYILSIALPIKGDVLLPTGEVKHKLIFGRQRKTFWMQNSKTCYRPKILH